jgi:hypothetical protein
MRRSGAAERREHVECPGLEVVPGEDDGPLAFQVVRQPSDAREDLEWRHIHGGKGLSPSRHQVLYFIFHTPSLVRSIPKIYLDIKRYATILSLCQEKRGTHV